VTVFQSGVPFRDLDCFFKAVRVNEPKTPDRFLGFRKQELPVRIKIGQKVVGATLEADSFNIFVRRDAFLVPSHLENE
jgi:hypothetical protein